MGKKTSIQYVHSTFNPSMGCNGCELWSGASKVCYAGFAHEKHGGAKGWSPKFEQMTYYPERAQQAMNWGPPTDAERKEKPYLDVAYRRIIFMSDMSDLLSRSGFEDEDSMFKWIYAVVIKAIESDAGRRHIILWFTKRASVMLKFDQWMHKELKHRWPSNLVPFTSVTSETHLRRLDPLLQIRARFFGVSCEPLWGPVPGLRQYLDRLTWVVAGGQSESTKVEGNLPSGDRLIRPSHSSWFRTIRDDCREMGVPFFFKQWGALVPANPHEHRNKSSMSLWVAKDGRVERGLHPDGHFDRNDDFEFQTYVGKHHAHRLLDGVECNGVPTFGRAEKLFDTESGSGGDRSNTPWA